MMTPDRMNQMRQILMMLQARRGMGQLGAMRPGMGMGNGMRPGMMPASAALARMPQPGNPGGAAWDAKENVWDTRLSPNTGQVADLNQRNPYLTPAIADLGAHGQLGAVKGMRR